MHYNDNNNYKFENDILDQIIYRGEGNSSIVIALKTKAKVIRLLKKDGKIMKSSQDHHATQHPMQSIKFIHLIMKPLMDPFLSGPTELIHLKSDFINLLSKGVEAFRPIHRLDKTLLLDDQYALVMDDLCMLPTHLTRLLQSEDLYGPTISVEIKPKQGFLPMHRHVMKSSVNDQFSAKMGNCCLYGSTQYLKLARGRINKTSNYCPINLFSGCPVRMKSALEELIQNPQNNLRVFKDLVLAYGESCQVKFGNILENFFSNEGQLTSTNNRLFHSSHEDRLVDLLIQCLLKDHDRKPQESKLFNGIGLDNENSFNTRDVCFQHLLQTKCRRCDTYPSWKKHKSNFTTNSCHRLPQSCVLSSILKAQKLDSVGAHEAMAMLDWLQEHADPGDSDVLEKLSKPQIPEGFGSLHQLPSETKQEYFFRKIWEFLVSLTAKDCSIIVTMRRIDPNRSDSIMSNARPEMKAHLLKDHRSGDCYLFNVAIADLDQKMPLKIYKRCDNLNLMFQAKKETINNHRQSNQKVTSK